MKKLKSFIFWTFTILLVLVLVGIALVKLLFTPEEIVATFIPKLERVLERKVEYGEVEFTIFTGIGARIYDLQIKNYPGFDRENFLTIKQVDCNVRLLPLLRGKIEFSRLIIRSPEIYLIDALDGSSNYTFAESRTDTPGDELALAVPLVFDEFHIRDLKVIYRNDSTNTKTTVGKINFDSELITGDIYNFSGEAKIDSLLIQTEEEDYLYYPLNAESEFEIEYFTTTDSLHFAKCDISLDAIKMRLSGSIIALQDNAKADLHLIAPSIRLQEIKQSQLLVDVELLDDFELNGEARLDASYIGFIAADDAVKMRGKFSVTDFKAHSSYLEVDLTIKLAELNFNSQSLSLYTQDGKIGEMPASFSMAVDNFEDPNISAELEFSSGVGFIAQLLQLEPVNELSGSLALKMSAFGNLHKPQQTRLTGNLDLTDFSYQAIDSPPLTDLNLACQFLGGDLAIQKCNFKWGLSDFNIKGLLTGFTPYLAEWGEVEKKPFLTFEASSKYLNLDELFPEEKIQTTAISDSVLPEDIPFLLPDFDAQGSIQVQAGSYNYVNFSELTTGVQLNNRILYLDSIQCLIYDGVGSGEVVIDLVDPLMTQFDVEYDLQAVEVNSYLSRLTAFDDHLFGKVNMKGEFHGRNNLQGVDLSSIKADGELTMNDGRMVNLPILAKIADQLKLKATNQETIRDLYGTFEVKDSRVAFHNWRFLLGENKYVLSGSVGFDGSLDYQVETEITSRQAARLDLPPVFAGLTEKLAGSIIRFKIGGNYSSPNISIISLKPKDKSLEKQIDKGKNFIDMLFGN